jgi:hypothetical protein
VFISVNLHEHQPIKFHIIHDKDKILCQDSKIDFLICHDRKKQYRSPPFIRLLPLMANPLVKPATPTNGQPSGQASYSHQWPTLWSSQLLPPIVNPLVKPATPTNGQPSGQASYSHQWSTLWSSQLLPPMANHLVKPATPTSGQPSGEASYSHQWPTLWSSQISDALIVKYN